MRLITIIFILVSTLIFSDTSYGAYLKCDKVPFSSVKPVKWTNNDVTFTVDAAIWNNPTFKAAVADAVDYWNSVSPMEITLQGDTGSSMSYKNNINEIYFGPLTGNSIGLARRSWGGPNISSGNCFFDEVDIIFTNIPGFWDNTPEWGDSDFPRNMGLVAVHELGHALGQEHDDGRMASMNTQYPVGGQIGHTYESRPYGSDSGQLRSVYGIAGQLIDVAASMWTVIPPPTEDFEGSAFTVDILKDDYSTPSDGSLIRGENVFFRYTISNLSSITRDLEVKFYMSDDRIIGDAGDVYLGMSYYTLPHSTDLTGEKYMSIPTSRTGFQYFGYSITSPSGELASKKGNNKVSLYRHYYIQ